MEIVAGIVILSAATLWILILGGWYSVYLQRLLGIFLLARADSLISQRESMAENTSKWRMKVAWDGGRKDD